jgi:hypothetical protein
MTDLLLQREAEPMSDDRHVDRALEAFLAQGPEEVADRVVDVALEHISRTRQRRVIRMSRRSRPMKLFPAAAAVIIIVLAVGGALYLTRPGPSGVGGPGASIPATAAPSAPLTPAPTGAGTPVALPAGVLQAGTYVAHPFGSATDSMSFTVTVPDGWDTGPRDPDGGPIAGIWPAGEGYRPPHGMALGFVDVSSIESDPCDWLGSSNDIAIGPSADDLATALSDQAATLSGEAAYTVSAPTDVSLGGYSGKYLEVTMPTEVFAVSDPSATISNPDVAPGCGGDQATYRIWDGHGFNIYVQGPANRWQMWSLDVEEKRVVVLAHDFPGTPAEDRAELRAIVDSIRIEP